MSRRSVRILPERTVDAWFAWKVIAEFPDVLLWAPSPPAQAAEATQPWDFAAGGLASVNKLFIVETKALIGYEESPYHPKVPIDLAQLCVLALLEHDNQIPIFYAIPGITEAALPVPLPLESPPERASLRMSPRFGSWLMMLRPGEVLAHPSVADALLDPGRTGASIATATISPRFQLETFIDAVKRCDIGKVLEPGMKGPLTPNRRSESESIYIVREALQSNREPSFIDETLHRFAPSLDRASDAKHGSVPWKRNHLSRTHWVWTPVK